RATRRCGVLASEQDARSVGVPGHPAHLRWLPVPAVVPGHGCHHAASAAVRRRGDCVVRWCYSLCTECCSLFLREADNEEGICDRCVDDLLADLEAINETDETPMTIRTPALE